MAKVRANIQRNVWIQIEMTEEEAESFYRASSKEVKSEIEIASLIKRIKDVIHETLHVTMVDEVPKDNSHSGM